MSIQDDSNANELSIHFDSAHSIWPVIDSLLYCPSNEDTGSIAENMEYATESPSGPRHLLPMEEVNVASSAFPAPSFEESTIDIDEGHPSHMAQVRSSFTGTGIPCGPNNGLSWTINLLIHQMEQFTTTVHQYGTSTHALESKIYTCVTLIQQLESQLGNIVHRLDSMEQRLDSMERRIDGMDEKTQDIDGSCKLLDSYLLEVIKREKDFVQDMRNLREPEDSL